MSKTAQRIVWALFVVGVTIFLVLVATMVLVLPAID